MTYLALGDSYTIGELVPIYESFPFQLVQILRKKGISVLAPEIVAKTGFTTDELWERISQTQLLNKYDITTLLIGVNNQYRARTTDTFVPEFERLLDFAIHKTHYSQNVLVLSIPDWGVTPFAAEKDREQIAREIDAYNAVCREVAVSRQVTFIDITQEQRMHGHDAAYLASDQLHPSGQEYAKWAQKVALYYEKVLR